jgi:hypothetical protein
MFIIEDSTVTAKAAFVVVPTDTFFSELIIKIPIDINSIFIELYVT